MPAHVGERFQTDGLEQGGGQIDEGGQVAEDAASFDSLWPANGQRDSSARFIECGFGPGKGHSIVTGHEDQRVFQFAGLLQDGDHLSELLVEPLDFQKVIQEVLSNIGLIRIKRRDLDLIGSLAASEGGASLKIAVGFIATKPEAEGLFVGLVLEELGKVGGVVDLADF